MERKGKKSKGVIKKSEKAPNSLDRGRCDAERSSSKMNLVLVKENQYIVKEDPDRSDFWDPFC
ncbi:hypothetical protein COLO4_10351 [Corchorus olitorius]|uniref:Uncharacterized protein n=1 Tax=Corchorus olitorius TaxID=93759 RepID=A0A1R3K909_9ROSI|nr:hypothetical protein COLO4_10351 [Corchorus olitorius]